MGLTNGKEQEKTSQKDDIRQQIEKLREQANTANAKISKIY